MPSIIQSAIISFRLLQPKNRTSVSNATAPYFLPNDASNQSLSAFAVFPQFTRNPIRRPKPAVLLILLRRFRRLETVTTTSCVNHVRSKINTKQTKDIVREWYKKNNDYSLDCKYWRIIIDTVESFYLFGFG